MTEILGTVASETALIILAPCRMIPSRSTAVPTMNPGTSARKINGTLKASQALMNAVALAAEAVNSTPPFTNGLLATTPTGAPSNRPNPTISSGANNGFTSNHESASITPARKRCMSYPPASLSGTTDESNATDGAAADHSGGSSRHDDGRYEKYERASSNASASSEASRSPHPLTVQCMRAPPISSSVVFSPITISAIRGEPRYIDAFPSTMITTSQNDGMYAPPAADGPNRQQICGTFPERRTWL